ncbi:hypothetical protein ACSBR1_025086 [Camellia fascicularis]
MWGIVDWNFQSPIWNASRSSSALQLIMIVSKKTMGTMLVINPLIKKQLQWYKREDLKPMLTVLATTQEHRFDLHITSGTVHNMPKMDGWW